MRCCSLSARAFTLLTLVVLTSHSFLFAVAQGTSTPALTSSSPLSIPSSPSLPPTSVSTPESTSSSPAAASSSSADTQSSASSSPSHQSTNAPARSTSVSSTSTPASSATSTATETSSSSASSSASSTSATASSTTPSSSQTKTATSTGVTLISAPPSTAGAPTGVSYRQPSGTLSLGRATDGLNPTGVVSDNSSSPKGFLENKGAVAGVFTVVGLVGLAIVFALVTFIMRRRARRRNEEDRVYFEKYREPEPQFSPAADHHNHHDSTEDVAAVAASHDAYPDRSIHYGANMAGTGAQYAGGNQYAQGLEYPPGTAYAAAASQTGQYQYGGLAPTQQYDYNGQARTSPTHPYADLHNLSRPGGAPPVNQHGFSGDDIAYA